MQAKGKERNKVSKQEQEVNLSQRIVCVLVLSAFVVEFGESLHCPYIIKMASYLLRIFNVLIRNWSKSRYLSWQFIGTC